LARRIPLPADPAELRCIVVAAAACFAQAKLASRVTE